MGEGRLKGPVGGLSAAGFEVKSFTAIDSLSVSTAEDAAVALCQGAPMRSQIESDSGLSLGQATEAARKALQARFGDGTIAGRIRSFQVTAERPIDQLHVTRTIGRGP